MIAQISHTGNTAGIIAYHDKKLQEGVAYILDSNNINTSSRNNIQASINSYNFFSNEKQPTVHISLNFHAEDRHKITDELYTEIGRKYLNEMGYGDQPFVVYKHQDQAHPHIHIVTSKIRDDGTKISSWGDRYRSQNISRNIEVNYGLKEVSSIKNLNKEAVVLSNSEEYKTYIRSSVKEALSLRPKRKDDFELLLATRYGIQFYSVKGKGVGFALLDGNNERYKNGYGTKGIAASKIDGAWSEKRLKQQLSKNFENAPKRYRNLKATEGLIASDFGYFNKISEVDFNGLFNDQGTYLNSGNEKYLVVDAKGKNVYSERDLKGIDFSKISKTTELLDPVKSGLFDKIAEETLWAYKNDTFKKLELSNFIKDIADQNSFIAFYGDSKTFNRYQALLSEHELRNLVPHLKNWFNSLDDELGKIVAKEVKTKNDFTKIVEDFSTVSRANEAVLLDSLRLNVYNKDYSPTSAERATLAVMASSMYDKINDELSKSIYPTIIFDFDKYVNRTELDPELKEKVDKIIVSKYLKNAVAKAKKSMTDSRGFVEGLTNMGVQLVADTKDDGSYHASIKEYGYSYKISGSKEFISPNDVHSTKPANNFEDIKFSRAFENGNYGYAFSIINSGKTSDGLVSQYKDHEVFRPMWLDKEYRTEIHQVLNDYKKENQIHYVSDLKNFLKESQPEFLEFAFGKSNIPVDWSKEYLNTYTSIESIYESVRLEKERFGNRVELSNVIDNDNMSALIGLRNGNPGSISDYHGKYEISGSLEHSKSLEALQKQPYFEYYSNVFNEASLHLYGDRRDAPQIEFSHVLVYESFRSYIPSKHQEDYQRLFESAYIEHFARNLTEDLKGITEQEKVNYLNSKGIVYVSQRNDSYLKLGGSNHLYRAPADVDLNSKINGQLEYVREHGFNKPSERRTDQLNFVVAIEKGNFKDAAWLLKQNKASVSISDVEITKRKELKTELDKIGDRDHTGDLTKSISRTINKEEGGDGHYQGKHKKQKKGRRLR
mgnify:CR=1 FL=1